MAKIITDKKINLSQLDQELGSQGLSANFENDKAKIILTADDSNITQKELEIAVENHKAIFKKITLAEKLIALGLNETEVSSLLS